MDMRDIQTLHENLRAQILRNDALQAALLRLDLTGELQVTARGDGSIAIGGNLGEGVILNTGELTIHNDLTLLKRALREVLTELRQAQPIDPQAEEKYRQQLIQAYNHLSFHGFGMADLLLKDVPLERIFVRLSLTVEKTIREPLRDERGQERERVTVVQEPIELAGALQKHLLLIGTPGAGKSTLLRWLACTFAQGRQQEPDRLGSTAPELLPVLLELGQLPDQYRRGDSNETPQWLDFVPEFITRKDSFRGTPSELLREALEQGRCLFLCDGLDEVADRAARTRIATSLAAFARAIPGNRIVIGSRPAGANESEAALHFHFQRCEIQPFSPADIKAFFQFWYSLDPTLSEQQQRDHAAQLSDHVETRPDLLRLASTPLLSTILLLLWRNEGALPERRVELYERCCRVLLESWQRHRAVPAQHPLAGLDWEEQLRLVAPLAYAIHSQEQPTATREELLPVLTQAIHELHLPVDSRDAERIARTFFDHLGRSELLQYMGNDQYGFPHPTFREYLAARYLADLPDSTDTIDGVMLHLHETWWREVQLMTIARLSLRPQGRERAAQVLFSILRLYQPPMWLRRLPPNSWLGRLSPGYYLPHLQWRQRIAWWLGREAELAQDALRESDPLGVPPTLKKMLMSSLIDWMLRDVKVRGLAAVESLGQAGVARPEVITVLLTLLQDQDSLVRNAAAVRRAAIEILGRFGQASPEVITALLTALRDQDWSVRQAATESLSTLGQTSPEAIIALLTLLQDQDRSVRRAAAESLGQLGQASPEVIIALLTALRDQNGSVRRAAATSLGKSGQASPEVITGLLMVLHNDVVLHNDRDWFVRQAAAESLGQLGQASPEVIIALLTALRDQNGSVRRAAAESLGQLGQSSLEVIPALLTALQDQDGLVRLAATESLERLGVARPEVITALLTALRDQDSSIRQAAMESLSTLGQTSPEVITALLSALQGQDESVREAAATSLGKSGQASPEVITGLLTAFCDSDRLVRLAAGWSLGTLGQANPEVSTALLTALCNPDRFVRLVAVRGLEQLGAASPEVITALLSALQDQDQSVRLVAAESLGQLGAASPEVITALLTGLHDYNSGVRQAAAESLGKLQIKNPMLLEQSLFALSRVLYDHESDVVRAAYTTLHSLLDGRALPGYHWLPLRERRRRRRSWRLCAIVLALSSLLSMLAAWGSFAGNLTPGLVIFGALLAIFAIGARRKAYALRDPWEGFV